MLNVQIDGVWHQFPKGTRVIEVLISALTPFELMMGKLLGICLVGMTQLGIWLTTVLAYQKEFFAAIEAGDGLAAALHIPRWSRTHRSVWTAPRARRPKPPLSSI